MTRVQLKYGEHIAVQLCHHNSLVQIVSAALGGESSSAKPKIIDIPQDPEMAVAHLNRFLTFG